MFDFGNYSDGSNKLVVGKMKDKTGGGAIEKFVGLKPKMYSLFVDDNSKHKKPKDVNKNVVETISHNEYKHVLLNQKCLRYLMNGIQSKNHRIGTYEMNKIYLSCFGENMHILNNECDGLAVGC